MLNFGFFVLLFLHHLKPVLYPWRLHDDIQLLQLYIAAGVHESFRSDLDLLYLLDRWHELDLQGLVIQHIWPCA